MYKLNGLHYTRRNKSKRNMDTSRNRRIIVVEQTDGPSSDNDEVRVIEGNQPAKNKRVKKTMKKVKDKEEEELERSLRESGIDFEGMTKEEKLDIAQVIMMSKQEADERSMMEVDEAPHTDSEEEKQTTKAFQQAVHPSCQSTDSSEPEVESVPLLNKARSPGPNGDNSSPRNHHVRQQQHTSVRSPPSYTPPDQTLEQSVYVSTQTEEAFEEAVHPRSTPEEELMEEDPMPTTNETKKDMKIVKPIHQKQQRRQNKDTKNQTRIDHFAHIVIPDDRKSNRDKQVKEELDALISEDDSSPERKKMMTESIRTTDVGNSPVQDECDHVRSNQDQKLSGPNLNESSNEDEKQVKCEKNSGHGRGIENLFSDDEGNPKPSTSGAGKIFEPSWKDLMSEEDSSPIKRSTRNAKKTFVWSEESDEETQDLFFDKESVTVIEGEQKPQNQIPSKQNIVDQKPQNRTPGKQNIADQKPQIQNPFKKNIVVHKPQNQSHGMQEDITDFSMEEPFSEEFYKFPPLQRHYRSVRKQRKENLSTLFAPPETDPGAYTKALVQLFSLYHIRLAQLQKSSKNFVSWPKDPVKVGRHLDNTIDAKKRGLEYDFLENDEVQLIVVEKSTVPAGISNDVGSTQPSVKPLAKNFIFKTKNATREIPTPLEEIDDFVESTKQLRSGRNRNIVRENVAEDEDIDQHLQSYVSKPTRNRRNRNTANFTRQKSAEDFEPFPVNQSFKLHAEQGRKRKLYTDNDHYFGPTIEDDNSNDSEKGNKPTGRVVRIVKLKGEESAKSEIGRPGTQRKRGRGNWKNRSQTATRGSLKRMPSDLSAGSVESAKSDELNGILDPERPPSRSSDGSLDGLSQSSDVLLDPNGQLYSTQFCAMQEKRAKTPTNSYPTAEENEALFRQYMSQHNEDQQQESNLHFSTSSATQSFESLSKASHETWSKVSSILPQTVKSFHGNDNGDKKTENNEELPSLKTRIFKTFDNLIKLGPGRKTQGKKPEQVSTESTDHVVHGAGVAESEHLMDTQGFQMTTDITEEDDIQQVHVKREGRTYSRKGRKRQLTESNENEQIKVPKVTVQCPMCSKLFPQDKIETHAADCNGPGDDENSRFSSNDVQEIPGGGSIEPSSSGMQRPHLPRMNRKQDEDVDFVIEDEDSDKENPAKINLTCYVCDKVCRNKNQYDQHVEKCLEEAKRMQHQMDAGGMENIDVEEPVTSKRTTRSAKACLHSAEGQ